jgi:hypothetical protein
MNRTTMHAISLWQPWASALFAPLKPGVSHAVKLHETRSWPMPKWLVNERVAIHAAKRETRDEREFWTDTVMDPEHRETYGHAFAAIGVQNYHDLPRGALIGTVVFGPSRQSKGWDDVKWPESDWGNYSEGRWAWPVIETHHFAKPIPCVGRQGFFIIDTPIEAFGGILAPANV